MRVVATDYPHFLYTKNSDGFVNFVKLGKREAMPIPMVSIKV